MYVSKRVIAAAVIILLLLAGCVLLASQWPQSAAAQNREISIWKLPYEPSGGYIPFQFAFTPEGGIAIAYGLSGGGSLRIKYIIVYSRTSGAPLAAYVIDARDYPSLSLDELMKRAK